MTFQDRLKKLELATGWKKPESAEHFGMNQAKLSKIRNATGKVTVPFVRILNVLEQKHAGDLKALDEGYITINYTPTGKIRRKDWRIPVVRPQDLAEMAEPLGERTVDGQETSPRRTPKVVFVPARRVWFHDPGYIADRSRRRKLEWARTRTIDGRVPQ